MYSLLRTQPVKQLVLQHAPTLGGSLLVAELFYKFGSFTLEAVAFLGTWFLLDAVLTTVLNARTPAEAAT